MIQAKNTNSRNASSRRAPSVRLLLALLIFSPLVYSEDGDPYREYEVVIVGMLFLLIAIPNMYRLRPRVRSCMAYVLAIACWILLQPVFVESASLIYNLKFIVVFLACFLPSLYLSNCNPLRAPAGVAFVSKGLWFLFALSVASLVVSSVTGLGEVYSDRDSFQQRAFSWLGDSFSPVMAFFLYYFAFRRNALGVLLSATCLVFVMQAKMATGMATFGYLIYLFTFGKRTTRLFLFAALVLTVLFLPVVYELAAANIHNFEYSLNNRFLSIDAGLAFFQSSPWFGVGANQTFTLLSGGFDVTALDRFDSELLFYQFFQIHNSFIRIMAELGLIGFLLFAAFCMAIIRQSHAVLTSAHAMPRGDSRALLMACALWLISFVLFYQTTGWFEPGHPQLSWLICFLTLMNFAQPPRRRLDRTPKGRFDHPNV